MIQQAAFLALAFVMFVSMLSFLSPVENVAAGTNGQQLQIKNIMGRGIKVTVQGKNNYGQNVTWTGYTPGTPSQIAGPQGETVYTTGHWWVGKVYVRVYKPYSTTVAYACYKEVPKLQWTSNWTTAVVGYKYSIYTPCG